MTGVTIRRATAADLDILTDILADAFQDDPLTNYAIPLSLGPEVRRRQRCEEIEDDYLAVGAEIRLDEE